MLIEITLPQLDGSTTQATIEHYFCQPGDAVTPGLPLAIALTERFEWEIPATAAGTLAEIVAQPGMSVPVGAALVRVESVATDAAVPQMTESAPTVLPTNGHRVEPPARVTPLARKIATVYGLDLTTISGSGRGGLVTRADVLRGAQTSTMVVVEPGIRPGFSLDPVAVQPQTAPAAADPAQLPAPQLHAQSDAQRQAVPAHPQWDVPHAIAVVQIDLQAVLSYTAGQAQRLARRGITLTPTSCVAAAVVAALSEHRLLNSVWSEAGIVLRGAVDLAVVQQAGAGRSYRRVVTRAAELNVQGLARALSVAAEQQASATFTLAETGTTHWSEAAIPTGQAAILNLGAIEQRPVVVTRDGVDTIVIRPLALLALAYDARIIMSPHADAFLGAVKRQVEHFAAM